MKKINMTSSEILLLAAIKLDEGEYTWGNSSHDSSHYCMYGILQQLTKDNTDKLSFSAHCLARSIVPFFHESPVKTIIEFNDELSTTKEKVMDKFYKASHLALDHND